MKYKHFIVHRSLNNKTGIDVQDILDEVLAMAEVNNMILQSSFIYEDQAKTKHLYLIFINK